MKKALLAVLAIIFATSGASANSLTFQNVTFSTADLGGGELQLTITNALNANGNWAGIKYLESFQLSNVGTFTTATVAGFTTDPGGLSNGSSNGCNGNGSGVCFFGTSSPLTLTNNVVLDIFFSGGTTNFSLPHLKVDFWANNPQTQSTGDLLSQDIGSGVSATPLPASWTMMLSVLALALGLVVYQRARGYGAQSAAV